MTKAKKEAGVPTWRYYLAIIVVGGVMYFAGVKKGDISCHLETANIGIQNQKEVYENDNKIEKSRPDVRDFNSLREWMHND